MYRRPSAEPESLETQLLVFWSRYITTTITARWRQIRGLSNAAAGLLNSTRRVTWFQTNSTLQHYDAIEIIALGVENCICMFCDSQ